MGVARMLRSWRARVQEVWPDLHGHQLNGLAAASLAMAQAQHCQLSRMAAVTVSSAKVPSSERRWQRLLANRRLQVQPLARQWARSVLADAGSLLLAIDETPQANHLRSMKLSRLVRGRALPLLWYTYRPHALPMNQPDMVLDLLKQVDALLPKDERRPTLLADRGLSWSAVVDFCTEHGWHFVLRLQHPTRVKLDDGRELAAGELAPRKGACWRGAAQVFKGAGWRAVNLVAWWPQDSDEPWLIISDLPPSRAQCRRYRSRMRQEQSFRDEKSHGFHWELSRVRDPEHADRLLLIMAMAMTLLIRLGLKLMRSGRRHHLERKDRRTLSVFQLGLRLLQRALASQRPPPPL